VALALFGGVPVRDAFPEQPARLTADEARSLLPVLEAPEWSRAGDDWPLPEVDRLEQEWALRHGAADSAAVSSGTAALTLILKALDLPPGDEVLTPAYGCPAVEVAVLAARLTPIHVDIDPASYAISPAAAAAAVNPRTAALIAVHFAGQPAPVESLARVAERYGIALVEDACLAPGAVYQGRPVGSWGRAAAFSLGVRKPISAGEGGLVVTSDPVLATAVRALRSLGADAETGEIAVPGGNYRMAALQAAVARVQLRRLDEDLARRAEAAKALEEALRGSTLFKPLDVLPGTEVHSRAQFWIRYQEHAANVPRERVVEAVQAEGIPLFRGWPRPNYCQPVYTAGRAGRWLRERDSGREADHYEHTQCPVAERAAFGEALLLDFPLLASSPDVAARAAEALLKVEQHLDELRQG
jgi:dTDP-4-amino-4,6-dideoxygalactose transaminase